MYVEDAEDQEDFDLRLFLVLMSNEVEKLQKLPAHDNIIQLIDYSWESKLVQKSGTEKDVLHVVLELATGGDLFNYIFAVNRGFSEPIARYYFTKLMDAVEFMHVNDVCHRDLKLENLLLDENYNLKIADFGLSTTVESSYGGGVMYTRVGTERYMPPEMLEKNAYIGICADLFAAGVILFVLVMGMMPTHKSAESNDYLYRYFRKKEYEEYWTLVANILNLDLGSLSEEFFHLVTSMLKYDFQKRLTVEEIREHPWMKGPIATEDEVREELEERKLAIDKRNELDPGSDDGNEDEVIEQHQNAYDEVTKRGEGEMDDETVCILLNLPKNSEIPTDVQIPPRKIKVYDGSVPRLTEFFSRFKPDILLGALINFQKTKKIDQKIDRLQYKAQVQMPSDEENIVDFVVEILKVKTDSEAKTDDDLVDSDDEGVFTDVEEAEGEDLPPKDQKYCVSFRKKRGPLADFVQIYRKFKLFCGTLNNAERKEDEPIDNEEFEQDF